MKQSQMNGVQKRSIPPTNDVFKRIELLSTEEKEFKPLRKKNKNDQFESLPSYYTEKYMSSKLSEEDAKLIRKENRILLEGSNPPKPILTFEDLGLTQATLQLLHNHNIYYPTSIQMQSIPCICSGRDVLLLSETGSGKTLSYIIPLIIRLQKQKLRKVEGPSSLVLAPTKELVEQIYRELLNYFQSASQSFEYTLSAIQGDGKLSHRVFYLYGGSNIQNQIQILSQGIDILISTPGRCIDLLQKEKLYLNRVEYLVIDECDKMVDRTIEQQLRTILSYCLLNQRQTILCSATLPIGVERLLKSSLYNYFTIHIKTKKTSMNLPQNIRINTHYLDLTKDQFMEFIDILKQIPHPPVLVFVNSKTTVDELVSKLRIFGFKAAGIHSNLSPEMREFIFECFKHNGIDVLVSTDLLSRGIDLNFELSIVIYDMPYTIEDFIHRVGRTGRMNKFGQVYTLVTIKCGIIKEYKALLKQTNQMIPEGLEREEKFGPLLQDS